MKTQSLTEPGGGQTGIKTKSTANPDRVLQTRSSKGIMELKNMGINIQAAASLPSFYLEEKIHKQGFRIELLVQDIIIFELEPAGKVLRAHKNPLLAYQHLPAKPIGLLIDFFV